MTDLPPDAPAPEEVEAPQKGRWARTWPKAAIAVTLVAALATLGVVLYAGSVDRTIQTNLQRSQELPTDDQARPPGSAGDDGAVNYVIIGSDSVSGKAGLVRSDALMVLHLDADREAASLISFPRTMNVPIPGHGTNKINSAYAFGGAPLAVRTLEDLLDVRMNHVVVIDFAGFVALTEQLGGVTVDNPYASKSLGFDFPAGEVNLRGDKALAFVREIKNLPGGDAGRAERQQLVMQAMLRKMVSKDMLLNPVKFNRFLGSAAGTVTVDQDLTSSQLRKTELSVRFTPEDIQSIQVPADGVGSDQMNDLAKSLQQDTMADYVARYPWG